MAKGVMMTKTADDAFWDDLREDLADPDFLRAYVTNWVRVTTTDSIINGLDDARQAAQLTKAALARAINADPSTLRRLFVAGSHPNPTIGTVAEMASALGMRLTLEPMPAAHIETTTRALLSGEIDDIDIRTLVTSVGAVHTSSP